MADKLKERIAILEEAEARAIASGRTLTPQAQAELDQYRSKGLAKTNTNAATGNPAVEERKANAFLIRALGANKAYEGTGVGPRSYLGQVGRNVAPDLTNYGNSDERQVADSAQDEFIAASLRQDSGAAIPPSEIDAQRRIYFPMPGDGKAVLEQKRQARLRAIEGLYTAAGRAITPEVKKQYEEQVPPAAPTTGAAGTTPPGSPPDGGEKLDASRSPYNMGGPANATIERGQVTDTPKTQMVSTDMDKRVTTLAQAAFNNGASADYIANLMAKYGYGKPANLDDAVRRRNRGEKGINFVAPQSKLDVPTMSQKVLGPILGSDAGVTATGFVNGLSLGGLDEVAGAEDSLINGKPLGEAIADQNARKELVREKNSGAYGVGDLAGGTTSALLGARALSVPVAGARALAYDAGFGALNGALENNDNRLGGAAAGGLAGAVGGTVGRKLAGGVANTVSPVVSDSVRFLRDKGIRLTPGQVAGRGASDTEEKLMSNSLAGPIIRGKWDRADSDFNTAFLNDSLGKIGDKLPEGATGTEAMSYAKKAFDDFYDKGKAGMRLVPDQQLGTELTALGQKLASGDVAPEVADRVAKIANDKLAGKLRANGGTLPGADYKEVSSSIGKIAENARKAQNFELSDSLIDLQNIIDGAARRSSPPEFAEMLDKADAGYALLARAQNAARMRGGETGTFSPNQLDRSVQGADSSVRNNAYLSGDALAQDWAEAGKSVLSRRVPNSGTADRLQFANPVNWPAALLSSPLAAAYKTTLADTIATIYSREAGARAKAAGDMIRTKGAMLLGGAGQASSPLLLPFLSSDQ